VLIFTNQSIMKVDRLHLKENLHSKEEKENLQTDKYDTEKMKNR